MVKNILAVWGWIIKNKKKFLLVTNQSDEMKYRMEKKSNKICKTKLKK